MSFLGGRRAAANERTLETEALADELNYEDSPLQVGRHGNLGGAFPWDSGAHAAPFTPAGDSDLGDLADFLDGAGSGQTRRDRHAASREETKVRGHQGLQDPRSSKRPVPEVPEIDGLPTGGLSPDEADAVTAAAVRAKYLVPAGSTLAVEPRIGRRRVRVATSDADDMGTLPYELAAMQRTSAVHQEEALVAAQAVAKAERSLDRSERECKALLQHMSFLERRNNEAEAKAETEARAAAVAFGMSPSETEESGYGALTWTHPGNGGVADGLLEELRKRDLEIQQLHEKDVALATKLEATFIRLGKANDNAAVERNWQRFATIKAALDLPVVNRKKILPVAWLVWLCSYERRVGERQGDAISLILLYTARKMTLRLVVKAWLGTILTDAQVFNALEIQSCFGLVADQPLYRTMQLWHALASFSRRERRRLVNWTLKLIGRRNRLLVFYVWLMARYETRDGDPSRAKEVALQRQELDIKKNFADSLAAFSSVPEGLAKDTEVWVVKLVWFAWVNDLSHSQAERNSQIWRSDRDNLLSEDSQKQDRLSAFLRQGYESSVLRWAVVATFLSWSRHKEKTNAEASAEASAEAAYLDDSTSKERQQGTLENLSVRFAGLLAENQGSLALTRAFASWARLQRQAAAAAGQDQQEAAALEAQAQQTATELQGFHILDAIQDYQFRNIQDLVFGAKGDGMLPLICWLSWVVETKRNRLDTLGDLRSSGAAAVAAGTSFLERMNQSTDLFLLNLVSRAWATEATKARLAHEVGDANELNSKAKAQSQAVSDRLMNTAARESSWRLQLAIWKAWEGHIWRDLAGEGETVFGSANLRSLNMLALFDKYVYRPTVGSLMFFLWKGIVIKPPDSVVVQAEVRRHTKDYMERVFSTLELWAESDLLFRKFLNWKVMLSKRQLHRRALVAMGFQVDSFAYSAQKHGFEGWRNVWAATRFVATQTRILERGVNRLSDFLSAAKEASLSRHSFALWQLALKTTFVQMAKEVERQSSSYRIGVVLDVQDKQTDQRITRSSLALWRAKAYLSRASQDVLRLKEVVESQGTEAGLSLPANVHDDNATDALGSQLNAGAPQSASSISDRPQDSQHVAQQRHATRGDPKETANLVRHPGNAERVGQQAIESKILGDASVAAAIDLGKPLGEIVNTDEPAALKHRDSQTNASQAADRSVPQTGVVGGNPARTSAGAVKAAAPAPGETTADAARSAGEADAASKQVVLPSGGSAVSDAISFADRKAGDTSTPPPAGVAERKSSRGSGGAQQAAIADGSQQQPQPRAQTTQDVGLKTGDSPAGAAHVGSDADTQAAITGGTTAKEFGKTAQRELLAAGASSVDAANAASGASTVAGEAGETPQGGTVAANRRAGLSDKGSTADVSRTAGDATSQAAAAVAKQGDASAQAAHAAAIDTPNKTGDATGGPAAGDSTSAAAGQSSIAAEGARGDVAQDGSHTVSVSGDSHAVADGVPKNVADQAALATGRSPAGSTAATQRQSLALGGVQAKVNSLADSGGVQAATVGPKSSPGAHAEATKGSADATPATKGGVLAAGGSPIGDAISLDDHSAGEASPQEPGVAGKSLENVAKATQSAMMAAGSSPADAAKLAGQAVAQTAVSARRSPADVGKALRLAVVETGGLRLEAARAAGKTTGQAAIASGKLPAEAAKEAQDVVLAAGGSQTDASQVAAEITAHAAIAAGRSPDDFAKITRDGTLTNGGSTANAAQDATLGAGGPLTDTTRPSDKAATQAAITTGRSHKEIPEAARVAGDGAAKTLGASARSPEDVSNATRVVGDQTAEAAIATGRSPQEVPEVARVAGDGAAKTVGTSAGRSPKEVPEVARVAGDGAAKTAGASARSPKDIANVAGDESAKAGIAARRSPEEVASAAQVAGGEAVKAAIAAGKSPEEVAKVRQNAARAAGGSPVESAEVAGIPAPQAAKVGVLEPGGTLADTATAAEVAPAKVTPSGDEKIWSATAGKEHRDSLGFGLPTLPPQPIIIAHVAPGSWAGAARAAVGDEIIQVNGVGVNAMTKDSFKAALSPDRRPVEITFRRRLLGADSIENDRPGELQVKSGAHANSVGATLGDSTGVQNQRPDQSAGQGSGEPSPTKEPVPHDLETNRPRDSMVTKEQFRRELETNRPRDSMLPSSIDLAPTDPRTGLQHDGQVVPGRSRDEDAETLQQTGSGGASARPATTEPLGHVAASSTADPLHDADVSRKRDMSGLQDALQPKSRHQAGSLSPNQAKLVYRFHDLEYGEEDPAEVIRLFMRQLQDKGVPAHVISQLDLQTRPGSVIVEVVGDENSICLVRRMCRNPSIKGCVGVLEDPDKPDLQKQDARKLEAVDAQGGRLREVGLSSGGSPFSKSPRAQSIEDQTIDMYIDDIERSTLDRINKLVAGGSNAIDKPSADILYPRSVQGSFAQPGVADDTDIASLVGLPNRAKQDVISKLSPSLESLTIVRSRSWRHFCDLRSYTETSLLRVGELQEAMLVLLEQMARRVLRPEDAASMGGSPKWLSEVSRLTREVESLDQKMGELFNDLEPLGDALLKATARGVRLVIESRVSSSGQPLESEIANLAGELNELRKEEQNIETVCDGLAERVAVANRDLRAIAEARRDLPLVVEQDGPSSTDARLQFEASTLDAAGERTRRLLQSMTGCLGRLQSDAHGLLQYLDASELLRNDYQNPQQHGSFSPAYSNNTLDSPMPRSSPVGIGVSPGSAPAVVASSPIGTVASQSLSPTFTRWEQIMDEQYRFKRMQLVWQSWLLFVKLLKRLRFNLIA